MTTAGRVAVAVAGAGLVLWLLARSRSASGATRPPAPPPAPQPAPPTRGAAFYDPGPFLPGLAPAYAVLKPIADHVTTPLIHTINSTLGLTDIGAQKGPVANADGTYTIVDGGFQWKVYPDGHRVRILEPISQRPVVKAIVTAGKDIAHVATGTVHYVEGLF